MRIRKGFTGIIQRNSVSYNPLYLYILNTTENWILEKFLKTLNISDSLFLKSGSLVSEVDKHIYFFVRVILEPSKFNSRRTLRFNIRSCNVPIKDKLPTLEEVMLELKEIEWEIGKSRSSNVIRGFLGKIQVAKINKIKDDQWEMRSNDFNHKEYTAPVTTASLDSAKLAAKRVLAKTVQSFFRKKD